jgi:predicted HicB family RNase H-like nuclease
MQRELDGLPKRRGIPQRLCPRLRRSTLIDVIAFQGKSVAQLKRAFKDSVDDYLAFCASRKEQPEKPFSGSFLVRMAPEMHRRMAAEARREGKSLNAYAVERLKPRSMTT